jgi:multiple sugar transport system permease protein
VLQLVSCSLVGYGLGRYKFKGSGLVFAAVLFTIILPTQVSSIPQFYNYRWFDLFGIGKIVGLFTGKPLTVNLLFHSMAMYTPALFAMGLKSGIFIFLFKQFFASMPKDLEEAAKLDGCGPFTTFLRVMIPNIKPVVVTTILLSVIYYWNDTLTSALMLRREEGMTLMIRLEQVYEQNGQGVSWSYNNIAEKTAEECAMIVAVVLPLILIFLIGQRYFVECMDRSGSKG